ncbi:MAG: hypothetical protein KC431_01620, partial [Myxococcales bacterium]|nr:hypothetical protein [Myxococcales bacterium]
IMLDAEYSAAGEWAGSVHSHLPRTWAQQEISYLTQHEGAAAKERIIALSREYNVLSRWTALLVLENDRMYREFNVARKAENKDGWNGKLGGGESKPEDQAATGTTSSADAPTAAPGSAPATETVPAPIEEAEATDKSDAKKEKAKDIPFDDQDEAPAADFGSRERNSSFDEAEDRGDFDGEDDSLAGEESFGGDIGGGGGGSGSGRGSGGFAPEPPPQQKPSKAPSQSKSSSTSSKPKPSSPQPDVLDPWGGGSDGGPWKGGGGGWGGRDRWRAPQLVLRDANGPSSDERSRIAELQRIRDVKVGDRKAHRDLVTKATRAGDPNRLVFAAAWAEADPDHAPALLAHADALAAAGDPLALRAYGSAVEAEPFSTKLHGRMADALTAAGDFERACSHRRALVSIDPQNGTYAAELVECLVQAGRTSAARAAANRASERISSSTGKQAVSKAAKAIDQGFVASKAVVHSSPDLRAELRWSVAENLDLAFIDRRGHRLSVMRPEGVLAREERDGAERVEILTMREVKGTVFIEVTRPESRSEDPVFASLTVKGPSGRKTWTLRLEPGTQRVALAKWQ